MKKLWSTAVAVTLVSSMLLSACGGGSSTGSSSTANGEWKPTKAIEYIAPAGAGGGWDTTARTTAKVLEEDKIIEQSLAVVNKPGGGGAIGWKYVDDKKGDDRNHTLFVTSPPIIFVPLNGQSELTHKDFTPIAALTADYAAFIVKADSPYQNLGDLMNELKTNPANVSVAGTSSPGSMDHMQFLLAADKYGVDVSKVQYVSFQGAEGMAQLLGGHVTVFSSSVGDAIEQYKAGNVRVLAITAPERLKGEGSDFPTVKEQGVDFEFVVWRGVMGHKDMSPEAVTFYEQAFKKLTESPAWIEARENLGWIDNYMGSEEFKQYLDEQYAEIEEIMKRVGLAK